MLQTNTSQEGEDAITLVLNWQAGRDIKELSRAYLRLVFDDAEIFRTRSSSMGNKLNKINAQGII